jgi:hypothetical protein
MAMSKISTKSKEQLLIELDEIVVIAGTQFDFYNRSNDYLYEGLAKAYMWWRDAKQLDGFLAEQYQLHSIRVNRSKNNEENFRGVIKLVWRMHDGTKASLASLQQWSYALKELDKEYTSNPLKFKQAPIKRLVELIEGKGGIRSLIGYDKYGKSFDEAEEEEEAKKVKFKRTPEDAKKIRERHLEIAKAFYPTCEGFSTIKTAKPIASVEKLYSLALVRKTERDGVYDVLATVDDDKIVEDTLIASYKQHQAVSPPIIQLLTEVIQTQCLPKEIEQHRDALVDATKRMGKDGKPFKQHKRMIFRKSRENILLSENRTSCSVVTIAKPHQWVIRSSTDVYLNATDRKYIEQLLLQPSDTNLYTANATDLIPALKDDKLKASHRLLLKNEAISKFRPIYFYAASTPEEPPPNADIKPECENPKAFTASVDKLWLERFKVLVSQPYLSKIGGHITRGRHKVLKLEMSPTCMFFWYDGEKGNMSTKSEKAPFAGAAKGTVSLHVLTKDFIPVMHGIASMHMEGKVELAAGEDVFSIAFATELAEYRVYIPAASVKARRSSQSFCEYRMFGARQCLT